MKKIYYILLASTAISSVSFANELESNKQENKKFFTQINAGVSISNSTTASFTINNKTFSGTGAIPSYFLGLEGGMRLTDNIRTGLSLENRSVYPLKIKDGGTEVGTLDASSLALMANIFYDFKNESICTPYILVGAGAAQNKAAVKEKDRGLYVSSNKVDNFAYKLGAGLSFAVNSTVNFDIRYQYADLGNYKFSDNASLYGVSGKASSSDIKFRTHDLIVGLGFKF